MPKPPRPRPSNELARRDGERRAIRAELGSLAVRARAAGLLDIAVVLDLAVALDQGQGWPAGSVILPLAEE